MGILSFLFNKNGRIASQFAKKSSDEAWVFEFELALGEELGGIFGVMQAFSNSEELLEHFGKILQIDMAAAKQGESQQRRSDMVVGYLDKLKDNDRDLLLKYWDFFGDSCARIHANDDFVHWIKRTKFEVMPSIFTHEILKIACHIMGK